MARVQVNDMPGPQALTPVASPVDTYVRPGRDMASEQFISALSELNPTITKFAGDLQNRRVENKTQEFSKTLSTMTMEQAEAYYASQRETETGDFRRALSKQFGLRKGFETFRSFREKIAAGEIDPADPGFEGSIRDAIDADLGAYQDGDYQNTYNAVVIKELPSLLGINDKAKAERRKSERNDGFIALGTEQLSQIDPNLPPEERKAKIGETIAALRKAHGPESMFKTSHRDMDDLIYQMAQRAALVGDVDAVDQMLFTDRGEVPSIASKKEYQVNAEKLRLMAGNVRDKAVQEAGWDETVGIYGRAQKGELPDNYLEANGDRLEQLGFTPAGAAGLMNTNRVAIDRERTEFLTARQDLIKKDITDRVILRAGQAILNGDSTSIRDYEETFQGVNGPYTIKVTAKEQLEGGTELALANVVVKEHPGMGGGVDQKSTFNNQVATIERAGVVYEPWKNLLSNGWSAASVQITNDTIPPILEQSYGLYRQLKAKDNFLAGRHSTDEAAAFYEAVEFAETAMGMDPAAAIRHAVVYQQDPALRQANMNSPRQKDLKTALANVVGANEHWYTVGDRPSENIGMINSRMAQLAENYLSYGVGPEKAVTLAQERIKATHIQVNGWLINAADHKLPGNFEALSETAALTYWQTQGEHEGIENASELVLAPATKSGTKFWLFNKTLGMPVDNVEIFDVADLHDLNAVRREMLKVATEGGKDRAFYTNEWQGLRTKQANNEATPAELARLKEVVQILNQME